MTATKEILFDEEARNALRKGIDQLADIVSITLGPSGYNVGLQANFGSPLITSDGASIAKDIEVKDPFINIGISLGKEVASKIKEISGDGTTTGIVLLQALVKQGMRHIAAGVNPIHIKRGMDLALKEIVKHIDTKAIHVQNKKETKDIATVSSGSNQEIGNAISTCFEKVGKTGIITIEEGKSTETTIEFVEGMEIDQGYLSSHFCTNREKLTVELENPSILITDKKIQSAQEILPILQQIASTSTSLLIIAEDIEGDVLSTLVVNKLKGILKVAAIKAPGFGDARKEILEDIAALTNAEVISEEKGLLLKDADSEMLGKSDRIIITKDKTTFIGKANAKAIEHRISLIEAALKKATSTYDKTKLEERKAKLQANVAIIQVGAFTEAEMKKKKQSFEDSLNATRAALEEGIAVGGGMTLIHAARAISQMKMNEDEKIGIQILIKAMEAPFRQIVRNTGYDPSTMLEEALQKGDTFGFNVLSEKVEDLLKAGITDPVKVIKNSLIHAVSMAGIILLTESIIAPEPSKD